MSKQQKKIQKKKERDKKVQGKLLRRRQRSQIEAKEEKEKERAERIREKEYNRAVTTVKHHSEDRMTEEQVKERLNHNMEILAAMEKEYEELQNIRKQNALTMTEAVETQRNVGGSADVVFQPNLELVEDNTTPDETKENKKNNKE